MEVETPAQPTPRSNPSQKRKQSTIGSFFGGSSGSQPNSEPKHKVPLSFEARKKIEDDRAKRAKKEQEEAMDHSVASSIIFGGEHVRKRVQKVSTAPGTLSKFFRVSTNCEICNKTTGTTTKAVCPKCSPHKAAIEEAKRKQEDRLGKAQEEAALCLKKCEDCVANNPSIDLKTCKNTDCSNLWDRMIAWRGLSKEELIKKLEW
jgi:hypothetical protein